MPFYAILIQIWSCKSVILFSEFRFCYNFHLLSHQIICPGMPLLGPNTSVWVILTWFVFYYYILFYFPTVCRWFILILFDFIILANDGLGRCFTEQPPHLWNILTQIIPLVFGKWFSSLSIPSLGSRFWVRNCVFIPFRLPVYFVGVIPFLIDWSIEYILLSDKRTREMRGHF